MKIGVFYTHVLGKSDSQAPSPEYYLSYSRRFIRTYRQFKPTIEHDLVVICCGGPCDIQSQTLFSGLNARFMEYNGAGWDVGAFQTITLITDYDWVMCISSPGYCWKMGWLELLVTAAQIHGKGVYGAMASFECSPHLRGGIFFASELMTRYDHKIETRAETYKFEANDWNFSQWAINKGYSAMLVTWTGIYPKIEWRTPPDIFRRGDQSNCLLFDRYSDWYMAVNSDERKRIEDLADGPYIHGVKTPEILALCKGT